MVLVLTSSKRFDPPDPKLPYCVENWPGSLQYEVRPKRLVLYCTLLYTLNLIATSYMIIKQTICDRTNIIIIVRVRRSTSSSTIIFQQCKDRTQSEACNSRVNVGTSEFYDFYHPNLSLVFLCVIASHCLLTFCPFTSAKALATIHRDASHVLHRPDGVSSSSWP